jgi:hypothetical protein
MTLSALTGVERVFYPMRDEQVARLGQFDSGADLFFGDRQASRRGWRLHRVGRGFSGTAAIELMAAVKR